MSVNLQFKEDISKGEMLVLGFQHVLTMVPASIAVPLILGNALNLDSKSLSFLVAANLFTSGLAVLIQVYGLGKLGGSKLPIVLGSSFAPLGPMIIIGTKYGLATLFGAIIVSAILIYFITFFMEKILVFFPQVVIGSFVTVIGIGLIPVAFKDMAGGEGYVGGNTTQNVLLAFLVLGIIVMINHFGKGIVKSLSLLIGIVLGTLVAFALGMVDFTPLQEASMIEFINPVKFGVPEFRIDAILLMTLFSIINLIQCIGVFSVLDEVCETQTSTDVKIRGLRGQAISQVLAGMFCSVPGTMFNENVGLIEISNVKKTSVIKTAGVMLLIIGIFPKISTLITIIPKPVIGGATLALFGVITTAGISILSKVDFSKGSHFTIVGTSLALGIGSTIVPEIFDGFPEIMSMLLSNGLFLVSFSAILLNAIFNYSDIKRSFKKDSGRKTIET